MRSTRGRLCGAVIGALASVALVAPGTAAAQYTLEPGPVPQEVIDGFADCPELPADVQGLVCLKLRAHDGELKLGKTVAQVDPIEVEVAIGLGPGFSAVIMPAEVSGAAAPVNVPGGILGITELDPVLAQDPLGLLTVSASPALGSPRVGRPDQNPVIAGIGFLGYIVGAVSDDPDADALGAIPVAQFLETNGGPIGLGLPLSIRLNNLLFGENCRIGTPEDPFVINLVNGATEPPEGVEPLVGEFGEGFATLYNGETNVVSGANSHAGVRNARFVDNTFAVPGAKGCDLLPGEVRKGIDEVEELLGGIDTGLGSGQGLFDPVINEQVGLPSPAGRNHAKFAIDIESLSYGIRHPAE